MTAVAWPTRLARRGIWHHVGVISCLNLASDPVVSRIRAVVYQSSAPGLLLLRQTERKLGVCRRLADAMPDRRDQSRFRHEMVELVTARAIAIGQSGAPRACTPRLSG
jgi:hypothetical protein